MSGAPDFDRLAGVYRWMEYLSFGPFLQRARTHFLRELAQCRRALVLGDGDGRFTAALLSANPRILIHAIDGSQKMLAALLLSAGDNAGRVTTEIADLRTWTPPSGARYDLVTTHFFLDCLSTADVGLLAARLSPVVDDGALWLVSDFAIPKSPLGRAFAVPLVSGLYVAFRWLTGLGVRELPEHAAALASEGWIPERERRHLRGLLVSQIWRFSSRKSLF